MATNLSFQKIATVPTSGLVVGRIYFETSTGMIKVATSATAFDKFGDGVKSASWDESAKTLKIINESGEEISLNLSDVASASAVTTKLAKKLNIGVSSDAAGTQSYYGLKKDITAAQTAATNAAKSYTDTEIGKIPAAIVYKGDDTTVTQSGTSTVTFAVGEIPQSKVTSLTTDLAAKATTTALNAVKATAEAAAPQATTYTKEEVDNKVASALNGKVPTTRTVNSKPLSANVVLAGADILVGGDGTYGEDDLQTAIKAMDSRITSVAASGVQSFGGQTGAITVDTANTTNGQVKFSMSSKQLKGTVNGLKSAAYTESSVYATSAQGTKADSALQQANIATGSANGTISVKGTDVPVKGLNSAAYVATSAFDTAGAATTALNSAKAYANGLMTWAEFE